MKNKSQNKASSSIKAHSQRCLLHLKKKVLKRSERVTAPPTGDQQESKLWLERETTLPEFTVVSVAFFYRLLQFYCIFRKAKVYLGLISEARS